MKQVFFLVILNITKSFFLLKVRNKYVKILDFRYYLFSDFPIEGIPTIHAHFETHAIFVHDDLAKNSYNY